MVRLAATPTVSRWGARRPPSDTAEAGRRREGRSGSEVFVRGELVAGRFRVEQRLGRGGFAEVYRAVDRSLGQRVALKVLRPRAARRRDALDALRREVLFARAVTHPHVCRIYDVFEHDTGDAQDVLPAGRLVVAMEWIEGPTLGERLRSDGPMTPSEALELARQLAAALDAAHDAGVLHLDLKSANILMASQPDGGFRAVVNDFGLAEGLRAPGERLSDSTPRGTPGYMAPEQRLGGPYHRATDVYALGCVLHEAIAGHVPKRGAAATSVPEPWRQVLDRCHRLDPDERPQSAGAVVAALEPPRSSRRLVATWATVGALTLAAAWGLTAGVVRPSSPATAVAVSADLPADWSSPWVSDLPEDDEHRTGLVAARDALRRLDPVAAVELADSVVAALPETARGACLARLTSAWAWNARGRVTRSFDLVDAAETACRSAAPATRLLASTLRHAATGAEQQALDGFTTLGTLFPAEPEYTFGLVQIALELGALDTARASLDRLDAATTDAAPDADASGPEPALAARLLLWRARVERTAGEAAAQLDAGLAAVAAAEAAGLDLLRAQALVEVGRARRQLALPGFGLEQGRAALVTFERAGDDWSVMLVRRWLAMTGLHLGDPAADADAVLAEAEAFYAAIGHPLAGAAATVARGRVALFARDGARARPFFEQALAVYERLGRAREQAGLHRDLAFVAHGRGALAEAEASYRTALDMVRAAGREASVANLLNNLGIVYGERGELRRALDTFAESERIADARSQRLIATLAGVNRGRILIRRGELDAARVLLARIAEEQATFDGVEATRLGSALALTQGDLARVDGELAAAEAIYRRARREAEERGDAFIAAQADVRLAALANQAGRSTEALAHAERATGFFQPGVDEIHRYRAGAETVRALIALGRLDAARGVYEHFPMASTDESIERRALVRLMAARLEAAAGRSEQAAATLRRLLAELPVDWRLPLRPEAERLVGDA